MNHPLCNLLALSNTRALSLFLVPLLLLSSMMTQAEVDYTWKRKIDYVGITTLSGATNNNHPQTLPVEKVARILSQLKYDKNRKHATKEKQKRVFSDYEIDILGNKLSDALTKVKTNEVIVFSISDLRKSVVGRKRLSTSGTVFIKDKQLHLLLGGVHKDLLAKTLRSGITGTYGPLENDLPTGSIRHDPKHEWQIPTFTGASHVNARVDWLSIDLTQSYEYAINDKPAEPTKVKYLTEKQKADKDSLEARIEKLEQARTEQPAAKQSVTPAPTPTTEKPVTTSASKGSIESRLRKLKELHESGALPESVYLEKVREVMAEL